MSPWQAVYLLMFALGVSAIVAALVSLIRAIFFPRRTGWHSSAGHSVGHDVKNWYAPNSTKRTLK